MRAPTCGGALQAMNPKCRMTWLTLRQPGPDVVLLCNYPGKVVRTDCQHCDWTGRYGLAGLVARFGPAAGLLDVLAALSTNCSRRPDWRVTGPCGAGFPALAARQP